MVSSRRFKKHQSIIKGKGLVMQSYTGEGEQNNGCCTGKNRLLLGVVELENSPKN